MSAAEAEAEEASIENPYWDEMRNWPRDRWDNNFDSYPNILKKGLSDDMRTRGRSELVRRYSWAIPSPESIAFILGHLNGRPVVEVGAGTGYWLWLLSQHGINVRAYDIAPPRLGQNGYHCERTRVTRLLTDEEFKNTVAAYQNLIEMNKIIRESGMPAGEDPVIPGRDRLTECDDPDGKPGPEYVEIIQGGQEVLRLPENADRVLLLSWPPYDGPMGVDVLRAFQGNSLFYIGEEEGGCTGDQDMHDLLAKGWQQIARCDAHAQWSGIHDQLYYYKRKAI